MVADAGGCALALAPGNSTNVAEQPTTKEQE